MRILLVAATICFGLSACGGEPESAGTKVIFKEVVKEVQRPCPVAKPVRPAKLAKPLPKQPRQLIDLLTAKLVELVGPGGYVERAEAALDICITP